MSQTSQRPLRILYVDLKISYMNPTRMLLPRVFQSVGQTEFFGPGYVDRQTLELGLLPFAEAKSPFDFLVCTELIPFYRLHEQAKLIEAYKRSFSFTFGLSDIKSLEHIYEDFCKLSAVKVVTALQTDYYNLTDAHIDALSSAGDYLIGWGREFLAPVNTEMELDENLYPEPNDNWLNAVESNPGRIISIPPFVSSSEFNSTTLASRRGAWSILGVNYKSRRLARQKLTDSGLGWKGKGVHRALALLTKLRVNPFNKLHSIKVFNYLFHRTLGQCKYSYTCGSSLRYPIRKFFEIPACGAVLVCDSCNGFEALGFRHKLNSLACAPEEILEAYMFLEDDLERAQAIADAGRKLVWRQHAVSARAKQIYNSLVAIKEGWFGGTYWHDGLFHINDRHPGSTYEVEHEAVEH